MDKDGLLQEYKKYAEKHTPYGWFNYQPIPLEGYEETIPLAGRNCFDRTNKILQHISENFDSDVSIVDFGSNLGFFVFEASGELDSLIEHFESGKAPEHVYYLSYRYVLDQLAKAK